MKTTNENLTNNKGQIRYEAPRVNHQYVELEYGIAAGFCGKQFKRVLEYRIAGTRTRVELT
ncbi:hypothetical protein ACFX5U_20115 [Sphingobacterium sp. SG20118]|uniref:hypothetical protein n=1 Tax=Sphingobacterium sp. SG20118 TaxID=3367156 RepID=UPI0037DFC588